MSKDFSNWLIGGLPHMLSMREVETVRSALASTDKRRQKADKALGERVAAIEADLGALTLGLLSLVKVLVERGSLSSEELDAAIAEVDELDGVRDGSIEVNKLYELYGVERPEPEDPKQRVRMPLRRKPGYRIGE